jgi:type I restriction enzyme S subunit
VSDEWQLVCLSDLGEVNRGKSKHRPRNDARLYGGPYPFIQTGDIKASGGRISSHQQTYSDDGLQQSRIWPAGTMVITIAANIAETAILTYPACFPDSVVGFIANPNKANVEYIEYLFRLLRQRLQHENVGTGSVQDNINLQTLERLQFRLPPLPEQRAIAATLGALDDKIELNRRMNETLEAMARALFRDWFVDFGPTRAKVAGTAPYLSPDLWSLFPDRLDDEGKPEGWEVGTLNDLAVLNPESWTARNAPAQVRYVDLANTKWGSIDSVEQYAWADAPSRARRILRAGDTIVGTVRPGNGSFCYVGEDGLTGSTGFAVLRPKNPRDHAFVWCAATSPENIDTLAHLADGGAYPAVRPDAVAATETVIPSSDVLEAFRNAVSANLDLMEANKIESRTLAQTRDLLLPRLMSGELRLAEAGQMAGAAQ